MKKLKGYFLVDNLMAISLIIILSVYIIPTLINVSKMNNRVYRRSENISLMQNEMERAVGTMYFNGVKVRSENENIEIKYSDISQELIEVVVSLKENKNEKEIRTILKKEGFYFN